MARNGDLVFAVFEGGEAQVAAGLAGHPVTEITEGSREVVTPERPRGSLKRR